MKAYDGVALAGFGETTYLKNADDSRELLASAIALAIADGGFSHTDIDGLCTTSFLLHDDNAVTIAASLGLELRWALNGVYGNASGVIGILHAARAIQAGDAEVVVVVCGDAYSVSRHMASTGRFAPATRDYLGTYGFGGSNGIFSLIQRAHMDKYGTTRRQLGQIAVTQRRHAQLNDNALLRGDLTIDDYLSAKPIADPVHLYDCVLPCAGADAVVVTTAERASRANSNKLIRIAAGGENHNAFKNDLLTLTHGWSLLADGMYAQAGIGPWDLSMIQLYDNYPIMTLIQLEDLGFCTKGEGGALLERTDFSLSGDLPLNTGGGQLSCGQAGAGGALIGVVEAMRQLRGMAGPRQLNDPRTALISGLGMMSYGRDLSNAAMILTGEAP